MNTQQGRDQYHEHIAGYYKTGLNYGKPYLKPGWVWGTVRFPAAAPFTRDYIDLPVHPVGRDAMRAFAAVLLHNDYPHRESIGGTVSMRNITGASDAQIDLQVARQYPYAITIHATGLAMDVNPSKNAYGPGHDELDATPIPGQWKAIRTIDGFTVARWGGDWSNDDGMHVEAIGCTRSQLSRGINFSTVAGWKRYLEWEGNPEIGGDLLGFNIGKLGDPAVVSERSGALQRMLVDRGIEMAVDNKAGDETRTGLREFQDASGVKVNKGEDGRIGDRTYAAFYAPMVGPRGRRGRRGPEGPQGEPGQRGPRGEPGKGLTAGDEITVIVE